MYCRVWVHRGRKYTEPPVAMIIDAILRALYGGTQVERAPGAEPYELPENLERLFAGKHAAEAEVGVADEEPAKAGCCSASEQSTCCDPGDKADCCGAGTGGSCGCR